MRKLSREISPSDSLGHEQLFNKNIPLSLTAHDPRAKRVHGIDMKEKRVHGIDVHFLYH